MYVPPSIYARASMQVIVENIVATFASAWEEEGGKKLSCCETAPVLFSSARNVFHLQIVVKAIFPQMLFAFLVDSTCQRQGDGVEETNLPSGSWWCLPKTNQPSNNENEIEKKRRQLRRSVFIIISMANLISAILASLLSLEIFTHTKESPLAMALSFR